MLVAKNEYFGNHVMRLSTSWQLDVTGGVSEPTCPYQCMSDKYRMPHCYTVLEDLMYKLGGPYLFTLLLFCMMVTLALVLSLARMKLVGNEDFSVPISIPHGRHHNDHSFPFLESLNEVCP